MRERTVRRPLLCPPRYHMRCIELSDYAFSATDLQGLMFAYFRKRTLNVRVRVSFVREHRCSRTRPFGRYTAVIGRYTAVTRSLHGHPMRTLDVRVRVRLFVFMFAKCSPHLSELSPDRPRPALEVSTDRRSMSQLAHCS